MSIVFDRLATSRICPKCSSQVKLYVTEGGIQFLACMNCPFDLADRIYSEEAVLNQVRQMAARDRREHAERKKDVLKKARQ
jgi:hypothetical protein